MRVKENATKVKTEPKGKRKGKAKIKQELKAKVSAKRNNYGNMFKKKLIPEIFVCVTYSFVCVHIYYLGDDSLSKYFT